MNDRIVLLVEDNADHALLTTEAIEAAHCNDVEVIVARDGLQAVDYLFATADDPRPLPSLVLLDIKLPGLDGFQVLERIKSDPHLHVIPVVMLTTSDDERDIALSYGLGSNSFITKPVEPGALFAVVSKIPSYWFSVNVPPRQRTRAAQVT